MKIQELDIPTSQLPGIASFALETWKGAMRLCDLWFLVSNAKKFQRLVNIIGFFMIFFIRLSICLNILLIFF